MKKIPSIFIRNANNMSLVTDECHPECLWVFNGEGVATRKFDGTCCMVRDGKLYKRYDAKKGKTPPPNFEPAQDYDPITGHMPGWIPVGDGPEDKWHREAFANQSGFADGTYELCGPKLQGNPEGFNEHVLIRHGGEAVEDCPRCFSELAEWFKGRDIEGVVWHHPDGRMAKIKGKDFGIHRKAK